MADGNLDRTIGFGEEPERAQSLAERYPFVVKELSKENMLGDQADLIETALQRYHEHRVTTRTALLTSEDLPGYRAAVVRRNGFRAYFAAVADDGQVYSLKMSGVAGNEDVDPKIFARRAADWIEGKDDFRQEDSLPKQWGRTSFRDSIEEHDWISFSPRSGTNSRFAKKAAEDGANRISHLVEELHDDPTKGGYAFHRFTGIFAHSYKQRQGAAAAHLMRSLDPEVQKIMRSTAIYTPGFANWLAGQQKPKKGLDSIAQDATSIVDETVARNRRQAISSYPVLTLDIYETVKKGPHGSMNTTIDEGKPLLPQLVAKYGVRPATLNRVQGATWQKLGRDIFRNPKDSLKIMDELPPEHIPQNKRDLTDLMAVAGAATSVQDATWTTSNEIIKRIGGGYKKVAQDLEGNPADGVGDLDDFLTNRLVMPGLLQRQIREGKTEHEALEALGYTGYDHYDMARKSKPLQGMAIRPALQASARWHRALPRLEAELVTQNANLEWDPLTGPIDCGGGVMAYELHSKRMLQREGAEQDHCVSGYDNHVLQGECLIYSVRKGDKTLSTVEIDPKINSAKAGKTEKAEVGQNMAKSNKTPSRSALAAGKTIAKHIDAVPKEAKIAYLTGNREKLASIQEKGPLETAKSRIGYDPFDKKQLEKSWEMVKEYLPKPTRKMGLDAFIESQAKIVHGPGRMTPSFESRINPDLDFDV